jgi:energy-coupling factor transport system substrate-specific component
MKSFDSAVSLDETVLIAGPDPKTFGIGARITLAVMSENYAEIILDALRQADPTGLDIHIGDVSTFVAGNEADLLRYLSQLISAAGRGGAHVSAAVHLSRGCPGEVVCDLPGGAGPLHSEIPQLEATGVRASAEWALYPLDDTGREGVEPDHMRDIYAAIELAKKDGTFVKTEHFVTRLEGDVAEVLRTVAAGWIMVGRTLQHVTSHVTLSLNSPSAR